MIVIVMLLMMELMVVPLKDVGNSNNKSSGIISSTVALAIMIVLEVKNKK